MPELTVITGGTERKITFPGGLPLRKILEGAGLLVRSGCTGNGACGLCLVKVEKGNDGNLTKNERLLLSASQINEHIRMACQMAPQGDLSIRIIDEGAKSAWRELPQESGRPITAKSGQGTGTASPGKTFGLAVDLGTTHISFSVWDMAQGKRVFGRAGLNPQSRFGSDIITRLTAASESPEKARIMGRLPLEAINGALADGCAENRMHPADIRHVRFVGNTPMLALLTCSSPAALLRPDQWTRPFDCAAADAPVFAAALGIHQQASVKAVLPFAGFVGSDLLAGVLATGLMSAPGSLLMDFGTNSEIALWDGTTLWVTSAAGGPAFEGYGIRCGMPAGPGAIFRASRRLDGGGVDFHVTGGVRARGICGSGLVDLIASLCVTGELAANGKFTGGITSYPVQEKDPAICLYKPDVDMFQRAKAATGAGVRILLEMAGINAGRLNRVCICGDFGRNLNVANAQRIGLLPDVTPGKVEICGNTALAGCEDVLLSLRKAQELEQIRKRASIVNLSRAPRFEDFFLDGLYLRPIPDGNP